MSKPRVLIFVVCYYAESSIGAVLRRIPQAVWINDRYDVEVLIIDDSSKDQTFDKAHEYARDNPKARIVVLHNPKNLGYGGNQKVGYHYAILKKFDVVVLLHGDGQYAPEYLDAMIRPILEDEADVVLGSRMIHKKAALEGKMPLYKWLGNQVLTFIQNKILGSNLAEFHTGYRAYRVASLASIPLEKNSDYFDFDTDILIQLLDTGKRIREIPVPTFYGDEISRVNGLRYAYLIVMSVLSSRVQRLSLFYDPKFDYDPTNAHHTLKLGYPSSHEFALQRIQPGDTVVDLGCGPSLMARELSRRGARVISVDLGNTDLAHQHSVQADLEIDELDFESGKIDTLLILDILENFKSPETLLNRVRERFCQDAPEVIITTGNVAFLPVRASLFLGLFNYSKRGILDLSHARLFTLRSLRRVLTYCGYEILEKHGIPAPYPLALGDNRFSRFLLRLNTFLIRFSPGLFSYQIAMIAKPKPNLGLFLQRAYQVSDKKAGELMVEAN